jgi:hypothetical protein
MIRWGDITIDRRRRFVGRGGAGFVFSPVAFGIVEALICAGPRTARELASLVYRNRTDGGPLFFDDAVRVRMSMMKAPLACIGLTIVRHTACGRSKYSIEPAVHVQEAAA